MKIIYNGVSLEHNPGKHHPENVMRLGPLDLEETDTVSGEELLYLVHSTDYIDNVRNACVTGRRLCEDTPASKDRGRPLCTLLVQPCRHPLPAVLRL